MSEEAIQSMRDRIHRLRALVDEHFPSPHLVPMSADELSNLRNEHPDLPDCLALLFTEFGCGPLGAGWYMVWAAYQPFFEVLTAEGQPRAGIVLVGSNNGEFYEACDTQNGWRFGFVGEDLRFEPHDETTDMIQFLERLLGAWVAEKEGEVL